MSRQYNILQIKTYIIYNINKMKSPFPSSLTTTTLPLIGTQSYSFKAHNLILFLGPWVSLATVHSHRDLCDFITFRITERKMQVLPGSRNQTHFATVIPRAIPSCQLWSMECCCQRNLKRFWLRRISTLSPISWESTNKNLGGLCQWWECTAFLGRCILHP